MVWRLAADLVLVVHLAFVVFVVLGGMLARRWHGAVRWHLPAVAYGAVISLVGFTCPLTPLEKWMRRRAGASGYDGGFVEHYVAPVLYPGEFTPAVKTAVALIVVGVNVAVYATVRPGSRRAGHTV